MLETSTRRQPDGWRAGQFPTDSAVRRSLCASDFALLTLRF
jgi:hypothetical protein